MTGSSKIIKKYKKLPMEVDLSHTFDIMWPKIVETGSPVAQAYYIGKNDLEFVIYLSNSGITGVSHQNLWCGQRFKDKNLRHHLLLFHLVFVCASLRQPVPVVGSTKLTQVSSLFSRRVWALSAFSPNLLLGFISFILMFQNSVTALGFVSLIRSSLGQPRS